jgi:hypothetical protein
MTMTAQERNNEIKKRAQERFYLQQSEIDRDTQRPIYHQLDAKLDRRTAGMFDPDTAFDPNDVFYSKKTTFDDSYTPASKLTPELRAMSDTFKQINNASKANDHDKKIYQKIAKGLMDNEVKILATPKAPTSPKAIIKKVREYFIVIHSLLNGIESVMSGGFSHMLQNDLKFAFTYAYTSYEQFSDFLSDLNYQIQDGKIDDIDWRAIDSNIMSARTVVSNICNGSRDTIQYVEKAIADYLDK